MPPYQGGGDMISRVTFDETAYSKVPQKFEAGTPNIAGAVGLGAAVRYLEGLGMERIRAHEEALTAYALERLGGLEGLRTYGPSRGRAGVISFQYGDIHPHDLATILDRRGIAIRAGHHCNQPLMEHLGVNATARASLYLYNKKEEVDALVEGLLFAADLFGGVGEPPRD